MSGPGPEGPLTVSVIIPARNEAPLIADAIAHARHIADEVIVADAHSPDGTGRIAPEAGAVVVQSEKARGIQAGARAATGSVLLFLHAVPAWPRTRATPSSGASVTRR